MRLLLVMDEVVCGGAELAFLALARALALHSSVHLALSEKSLEQPTIRDQCRAGRPGSLEIHPCQSLLYAGTVANLHPWLRRTPARELAHLIDTVAPELVLANLPTVERGQAVVDAARTAELQPPVWGYLHLGQTPRTLGAKLGQVRNWLVPQLLRRFDRLLAVSSTGAEQVSRRYRLPLPQVLYPPTALLGPPLEPAQRFRARERHNLPDCFLLGVVGRLQVHHKGQDAALRIAARLAEGPRELHLVVIGDGPDRGKLQSLAAQLGVSQSVSFLGWRDDVANLIPLLDALIMPSRYEGMPQTALQAATARVPVIAYAVDGLAELLPPDFSVPYGDEQGLERLVLALMEGKIGWPGHELAERASDLGDPAKTAIRFLQLTQSR